MKLIVRNRITDKLLAIILPYKYAAVILFNLAIFCLAYWASYYLRFEGLIPEAYMAIMIRTMPVVLVVQVGFFLYHDLFRGLWRYVSFADLQNILRASLMSMLTLVVLDFFLSPYLGYTPRSIFALNCMLLVFLSGGARFAARHFRERYRLSDGSSNTKRVMLVGPVMETEPIIREMLAHGGEYLPVAVIDPNIKMRGYRVYDVPIVGGIPQIARAVEKSMVQEIIFAWPDAPEDQLSDIIEECKRSQVRFKKIPSLSEVIGGRFRMADVRDIELEDLLPRPPIYIERDQVRDFIHQRSVLITGAGGSIGSELCRQLAQFQPKLLLMVERNENSLYETELALKRRYPDTAIEALIASINDAPGLNLLLQKYQPEIIFHAAAYKHVPLMERCPIEAAYNNILGTRNLVNAALKTGTEYFVMISTDKAVNPTSAMGASKHLAEQYVRACNGNSDTTKFIITRFGNVLGSAGSVIPIFKTQLAQGGPLYVTHPEIERFFMTIPEAVQLVLQAAYMGKGGDIFVLKMGRPVKIRELAEKLILLAGKTPGKDIAIKYTGLREGEKMYEELFNEGELSQPSHHPLIDYAIGSVESKDVWERHLDDIQCIVRRGDAENLIDKFKILIKNYSPPQH
ncbi:polysaccharide biosynthesis protein CapD [Desulfobacca acetoxidans DSM 11109]|uniref:Polysaccharide biosynthesis protein CapD n=2 Tax=Desulfobacca acetoxidans TaxID=60893 RepID=F2NEE2_DESAR|nr:polysaccharide biosynthesis protein CapD [Desulfobacca acetoxidans DSM 11109]